MSSIIQLKGDVDPLQALSLNAQLDQLNQLTRPSVKVDLTLVESLHLGAVNALVQAASTTSRNAGQFQIVSPQSSELRSTLSTAGLTSWMT
jgi:anti-anti-sigma factor